jgi:threonine dehydrogenase-like Zn-dependent dehydrogenase
MKAAFKTGKRIFLREVDSPKPGPGQIRLAVEACGICGTDLHLKGGEERETGFGHEVAGRIVEVEAGVDGLKVGQAVVLESSSACGRCPACRDGRQELCISIRSFFHLPSFGLADEMIAPAISAIPYEGLAPEVACLQEPLGVALDMVRLAQIEYDSRVLILGPGPIGLMVLALVRRAGAGAITVRGRGWRKGRKELALAMGADEWSEVDGGPLTAKAFPHLFDRILITSPPQTIPETVAVAAKGAIAVFIGIAYGPEAYCRIEANQFHFKKMQLRASFAAPALYGPQALRLLQDGTVPGERMVSHRFKLEEIEEAVRVAREDPGAVKVVVRP